MRHYIGSLLDSLAIRSNATSAAALPSSSAAAVASPFYLYTMATNASSSSFSTKPTSGEALTALNLPQSLLETYVPFFSPVRRIVLDSSGVDITNIVLLSMLIFLLVQSVKYLFSAVQAFAVRWLTSSVMIKSNDYLHDIVLEWISLKTMSEYTRDLVAESAGRSSESDVDVGFVGEENFNYADWDASKPPQYTPAYGTHRFWYKGTLFYLDRSKPKLDLANLADGTDAEETLVIRCLGYSTSPVKRLIQECKKYTALQKKAKTTVRRPSPAGRMYWTEATTRPSRPLETVYLAESDKENLVIDIKDFLHPSSLRFYAHRGIPYRRGYLFYGPAGTGKTSLSLALAGVFGLELFVMSLVEPGMTDQKLSTLFSDLPSRCIVLLEDIDTAALASRRDNDASAKSGGSSEAVAQEAANKEAAATALELKNMSLRRQGLPTVQPNTVTLSGLLNAIDGVASPEGRILIMTTNNPESLDKAIVRPGRVDMQVYFGYVSKSNAHEIFKRMYLKHDASAAASLAAAAAAAAAAANGTAEHKPASGVASGRVGLASAAGSAVTAEQAEEEARIDAMADAFAASIPELTFTPAEVQGYLLTRRRDPQLALNEVNDWSDELLAAKAMDRNISAGFGLSGASKKEEDDSQPADESANKAASKPDGQSSSGDDGDWSATTAVSTSAL